MDFVLDPPSGTRDFLAPEVRRRDHAFGEARRIFGRYGFDPLQTPAFERIEVLTGKYGDEGDKLIFKILRRGEHEASGKADLALRYDMTVPLARVVAKYGSNLPTPYKRYSIGPVWRADRPGKGRFREFTQCDIDIVGAETLLADAEIIWAIHDVLDALGIEQFQFQLNSRNALTGLLEAYQVPEELATPVLVTLDKLDKIGAEGVARELADRGLQDSIASRLVADLVGGDEDLIRTNLLKSEAGKQGLEEIDRVLSLTTGLPAGRVRFNASLVRGLDYYTGIVWEVTAPGFPGSIASGGRYDQLIASLGGPAVPACGGSVGVERILSSMEPAAEGEASKLDVAVTILEDSAASVLTELSAALRRTGLTVNTYLGTSRKLARQLRWASEQNAQAVIICGENEMMDGVVTIRDMRSGEQHRVPAAEASPLIFTIVNGPQS